jgi:hypothetical protein
MLYQMDVKSAFLNESIKEEVYVEQSSGFEDKEYPNHVYKIHKTLCGLKQPPRASYEWLSDFSLKMVLRLVKLTLLTSLERLIKIYLFAKFMLMS